MRKFLTIILCICAVSAFFSCSNNKSKEAESFIDSISLADEKSYSNDCSEPIDSLPTVIDFYATWCGPCKNIAPVFESLKDEFHGKANFISVDVDAERATAEKYSIEAMPTFIFLNADGVEVNRMVGADPDQLRRLIETLVNS